jgi:hypothetical protein
VGREKRRQILTTSSKGFTTAVAATAAISLCESLFSTHVVFCLLRVVVFFVWSYFLVGVGSGEAWILVRGAKSEADLFWQFLAPLDVKFCNFNITSHEFGTTCGPSQ